MNIEEIKDRMRNYQDLFGQPLLNHSDINACTTMYELADIIDLHDSHLENMANDAQNALGRFKREIGLSSLD